jgi:hypothetical protein
VQSTHLQSLTTVGTSSSSNDINRLLQRADDDSGAPRPCFKKLHLQRSQASPATLHFKQECSSAIPDQEVNGSIYLNDSSTNGSQTVDDLALIRVAVLRVSVQGQLLSLFQNVDSFTTRSLSPAHRRSPLPCPAVALSYQIRNETPDPL